METVTSSDGTSIAYDRSGQGPPLVVVNGGLSRRAAVASLTGALARDFTVYAYDRRGRGDSGDTAPYAVEREVEDLGAVIAAAGGSAAVHGHSSGAVLTLRAAAEGLPITRLAVYEPPFIVDGTRPRPLDVDRRVRELLGAGRRGDAVRLFLTEAVLTPVEAVERLQAAPMWPAIEALAHTLPYDMAVCGDYRIPADRLAGIRAPALVLDGGANPAWIRTSASAVAAALPDARQVTLEGQTHAAADDLLAAALVEFLTS